MSSAGLLASHSTLAVIIVNTHLFGRHWLTCSLCIHPVHCYRWVQNFFGVPSQHRDVRKWQARRRTIHTRRNFVSNNFGYFRRGLGEDVCVCVCVCACVRVCVCVSVVATPIPSSGSVLCLHLNQPTRGGVRSPLGLWLGRPVR